MVLATLRFGSPFMVTSSSSAGITRLGRYEILGRIATGGMATVYLARLEAAGGFSREFALKVIHPHLADQSGFQERFLEEARLASRVRHPNAVTTIDAGEDKGYSFLVLELIDGVNLRQLMLHRDRPLPAGQAAWVVMQVARGLHALHTATDEDGEPLGIIHRDLSPHNVMLDREGRAILIDLGLAKAEHRAALTQVAVLAAKLPYMSPEQARFEPLDVRSDVFALGTVLFELVSGVLPFGETHSAETLQRLQTCDTTALDEVLRQHDVPQWLIEVLLVCLRAEPDDRFASAEELADAIAQELGGLSIDEAGIKRRIAATVLEAMPHIAAIDQAAPLAPRIRPARARPAWRSAAALAALGAVLVALGLAGLRLIGGSRAGADEVARPSAADLGGHLASDEADDLEGTNPVTHRDTGNERGTRAEPDPFDLQSLPSESADTGDALAAPASVRRSRSSVKQRPTELKPNPYDPS